MESKGLGEGVGLRMECERRSLVPWQLAKFYNPPRKGERRVRTS
jgi:hypothetical protein